MKLHVAASICLLASVGCSAEGPSLQAPRLLAAEKMVGALHVSWVNPTAGCDAIEMERRSTKADGNVVADFALVKGWKADWYGNVVYRGTAQNFNPAAATAGRITVVEVEEIVPPGSLDPTQIHTPGIYVDRLIQGRFEKRIEKLTVRAA